MKGLYALPVIIVMLVLSCTKSTTTVNNYSSSNNNGSPAFSVSGLTDITMVNLFSGSSTTYISVNYLDSAQETVTLSLSGLPAGVTMDTGWIHNGIPSYNTSFTLYDTTAGGATPGTYPITLTAATPSGRKKYYTVNLRILPMYTGFLGRYDSCLLYCGPTVKYHDSVYMDATIPNKVWFANYANSGQHIYGIITAGGWLNIPAQTFGTETYTGQGNVSSQHYINISISGSCAINMFDAP